MRFCTIITLFLGLFVCFPFTTYSTEDSPETGTLILSYNTGPKGERLSRVRFVLTSENNEEHMYPKGEAYIEDKECSSRMVAIENLPIGPYKLKFLIPNADGLFEEVPEQTIFIEKHKTLRLDQQIRPLYASLKATVEILAGVDAPEKMPLIILKDSQGNTHSTSSAGKLSTRSLKPGQYTLFFEPLPGYSGPDPIVIDAAAGQTLGVIKGTYKPIPKREYRELATINRPTKIANQPPSDIAFVPGFGRVSLYAPFPDGMEITILISPKYGRPFSFKVNSKDGAISWQSPPLPPGPYDIGYVLPPVFPAVPSVEIFIRSGETIELNPLLITTGSVNITSNISNGVFLLRTIKDNKTWKGEGREYTFWGLHSGSYLLSFTAQESEYFIAPDEMRFFLGETENKKIKANFQLVGKLTLAINIPRSKVSIKEIGGRQESYAGEILNGKNTFILPEGRYTVTLTPMSEDITEGVKLYPPDPVEVRVKALTSEQLNLNYLTENVVPAGKPRVLIISANIGDAAFNLYRTEEKNRKLVGHFSGKYTRINLPDSGQYEISFDLVPNYESPEDISFSIDAEGEKQMLAAYTPTRKMAKIPAGKAIVGDPNPDDPNTLPAKEVYLNAFSIGVYEVTNDQYASWLTSALKAGKIGYVKEGDKRGQVVDLSEKLLFKTFLADPYSQISAQFQSNDESIIFLPLPGKDSYPVINVSWYGAVAYCQDNECRLLTEAEWEKAAGMDLEEPGKPLKKFKYGFGRDQIDRTWANYKDNDRAIQYFQVLTTPVGFYNGANFLPLTAKNRIQQKTQLAKSPYGAYDMSGNVWEWVSDWYDDSYPSHLERDNPKGPEKGVKKVVKGGCYDSLADGVRVSERMGLDPEYADSYTGFRVAK
jgi:formylglycine-generating enzyme required for sulfatase activity